MNLSHMPEANLCVPNILLYEFSITLPRNVTYKTNVISSLRIVSVCVVFIYFTLLTDTTF